MRLLPKFSPLLLISFIVLRSLCGFCEEVATNIITSEAEKSTFASGIANFMEDLSELHDNIQIGPVAIKPSYQVNEIFDDNTFDAPQDEVEDFYTLHKTRIVLETPFYDFIKTNLDYKIDIFDYEHVQERDHVNQSLAGTVEFNFANDFNLKFMDQIRRHVIPPGYQRRFGEDIVDIDIPIEDQGINVFRDRRDITSNIARADIDFPDFFTYLDFSLHYFNRDVSYQRSEFNQNDFNRDTVGANFEYQSPFFPITVTSGFDYSIIQYNNDKDRDNILKEIPFDVTWNIDKRNEIYLTTKYKITDYRKNSRYENFEGWEVLLGNRYDISPLSSIEIYGGRSIIEERKIDNNSYFDTKIGIKYTRELKRFTGYLDIEYFNLDFFETNEQLGGIERVDGFTIDFNVKYNFQEWWFAEFDYGYNRQDNTFSSGDLTKNTVSLGLGMNF
ncbi:MAG: outer membrane beta-barrel protein [Candidatus Kuenenia sp.]|nr:outer membrane beta-barrel protein [Candidatus Kuenenia hertensis]